MPGKSFYQPELDCLRFLAFLGVYCYHCIPGTPALYAGWPHGLVWLIGGILSAGAFGVPVFFALSAYLITSLLLREKESRGAVDTRSFYVRRILRIWPLYFAFVAFAAVLPLVLSSQRLPVSYWAGYLLLAGNWVYVFVGLPHSVAGPLWSVSIEEQFYLAWPLVVRRVSRAALIKVAVGLLIAANASRVFLAFLGTPSRVPTYNTIRCIDPIALGILLAVLFKEIPNFSAAQRAILFVISANTLILVAGLTDFENGWANAIGRCLVSFASAGILLSFAGVRNRSIRHPSLLYLGKISYGLYVVHLFGWLCAVHLLRQKPFQHSTLAIALEIAAAGLLVTIALAALSYRWLESPFLRLKERYTYVHSRPV